MKKKTVCRECGSLVERQTFSMFISTSDWKKWARLMCDKCKTINYKEVLTKKEKGK